MCAKNEPMPGAGVGSDLKGATVGGTKFLEAAIAEERFETDHAALGEFVEAIRIVGSDSTPEAEIDSGFFGCEGTLALQFQGVQTRRGTVERHVEKCRDAARSESVGAGLKAFPVRATGFVEMHMGVDKTR